MSQIKYTIDISCAKHPLTPTATLPAAGHVPMSIKRLFSYGTLLFQDKKKLQRKTYQDVLPLWQTLDQQYSLYVKDEAGGLVSDADGEDLRKISEIVGIACGAKVLCAAFGINPNRLVRHQATSGKRLDFEYYKGSNYYFHEMKGTTYDSHVGQKSKNIVTQKTGARVPGVRASSATITVYEQDSRRGSGTYVLLVDPPITDEPRPAGPHDELATVLVYYRNVLSITHSGNAPEWLAEVIQAIRDGKAPPQEAPENLVLTPRVIEPTTRRRTGYSGTIFDRRIYAGAVAEYQSFEAASEAIQHPMFFYGVSDRLVAAIKECRWKDVLAFEDGNANDNLQGGASIQRLVLSSGTVVRDIIEPDLVNEFTPAARSAFAALKRAR